MRLRLAGCLLLSLQLLAQNANKGSISGFVLDAKEGAIAGATVTAIDAGNGTRRETVTDEKGSYHLAAVDAGTYDVSVEMNTLVVGVKNVVLAVGADIDVEIRTGRNTSGQRVEIDVPSVSSTNSSATEQLRRDAIRDLPIDGRRFQDFASLAPGVQANPSTRNEISFLGQIGIYSNVMVDGVDYNNPFLGGIRGSERAMFAFSIPQSAIQEFQVVTNGYSPEYGRSTGGILNAISRSGGNVVHGDTFYQIRSGALGADNPFGVSPSGNQHQFGGGAGGPIRANRIFWFGAGEGQFASFPRTVRFAALDSVQNNVTPGILPAYQYFRSLEGPYSQTNNAFAALARLDYQFHDSSRLTARISTSNNSGRNAVSAGSSWIPQTTDALSSNGLQKDTIKSGVAQWTNILPHLAVNDLRFSYSAERRDIEANSNAPAVHAGTIGAFGTGEILPAHTKDSRIQIADSFTIQSGRHSIVLGPDYSLIRVNHRAGADQFGTFSIANPDVSSVLGILSRSGGAQGNRLDDASVIYRRQVGDNAVDTHANQIAFFAQDEWRAAPAVTISYGLRWEGQLNPSPATGNAFLVQNVRDFNFPLGRVNPTFVRNQLDQWAPRVAIAWNLGAAGRTVVRASAGMFYGQTPLAFYANALTNFGNAGGDLSLQITPNATGTVYQQFARAGINLNTFSLGSLPALTVKDVWSSIAGQPNQFAQSNVFTTSADNFHNPRSTQLAVSIEHQFAPGLLVAYQFNSLNTVHLPRVVDFNVPQPVVRSGDASVRPFFGLRSGTARPNANLGAVNVLDSSARSTYNGHSLRVQYRYKRLEVMSHFTVSYAKSDGEMQWPFVATAYQNPFDLSREWGWSSLDARYQSAGYALFHAPKGFDLTGLFRVRSGLPIDALTGTDSAELLGSGAGDRPLKSPGVPFSRNTFRNSSYRTVDVRLLKLIPLGETLKLQLSTEIFNVFNFANVGFIPAIDFPANPAFAYGLGVLPNGTRVGPNAGFLRERTSQGSYDPSTMAQQGSPFQAQLGVRFLF